MLEIVRETWSNFDETDDANGRSPDTTNVNSVNWIANAGSMEGTEAGDEVEAQTGNFLLTIDTQTDWWRASVVVKGQSSAITNTALVPRLFVGSDGDVNFFDVNGYAFQAPNTSSWDTLRATRVNEGADATIADEVNANDVWPDTTAELEWDGRGSDPILKCTLTRGADVEVLTHTDTHADKKAGAGHRYFGLMNGLFGEIIIWDLAQSAGVGEAIDPSSATLSGSTAESVQTSIQSSQLDLSGLLSGSAISGFGEAIEQSLLILGGSLATVIDAEIDASRLAWAGSVANAINTAIGPSVLTLAGSLDASVLTDVGEAIQASRLTLSGSAQVSAGEGFANVSKPGFGLLRSKYGFRLVE